MRTLDSNAPEADACHLSLIRPSFERIRRSANGRVHNWPRATRPRTRATRPRPRNSEPDPGPLKRDDGEFFLAVSIVLLSAYCDIDRYGCTTGEHALMLGLRAGGGLPQSTSHVHSHLLSALQPWTSLDPLSSCAVVIAIVMVHGHGHQ